MTKLQQRPSGLYFEEIGIGQSWTSQKRTVTETDVINFVGFSWDTHELHTDIEYVKSTPYGQRVLHGPAVIGMAGGLDVSLGFKRGTTLALLQMVWNFRRPVFIGDTIHLVETVSSKRESKDPSRGVVSFDIKVCNQNDEVTHDGEWIILFRRRPQDVVPLGAV